MFRPLGAITKSDGSLSWSFDLFLVEAFFIPAVIALLAVAISYSIIVVFELYGITQVLVSAAVFAILCAYPLISSLFQQT